VQQRKLQVEFVLELLRGRQLRFAYVDPDRPGASPR